jgi:hypothetical protein
LIQQAEYDEPEPPLSYVVHGQTVYALDENLVLSPFISLDTTPTPTWDFATRGLIETKSFLVFLAQVPVPEYANYEHRHLCTVVTLHLKTKRWRVLPFRRATAACHFENDTILLLAQNNPVSAGKQLLRLELQPCAAQISQVLFNESWLTSSGRDALAISESKDLTLMIDECSRVVCYRVSSEDLFALLLPGPPGVSGRRANQDILKLTDVYDSVWGEELEQVRLRDFRLVKGASGTERPVWFIERVWDYSLHFFEGSDLDKRLEWFQWTLLPDQASERENKRKQDRDHKREQHTRSVLWYNERGAWRVNGFDLHVEQVL